MIVSQQNADTVSQLLQSNVIGEVMIRNGGRVIYDSLITEYQLVNHETVLFSFLQASLKSI